MFYDNALGFIEVYGYIGAIEALDVALKTSNVSLVEVRKVSDGLVSVIFEGDVAACKAAVEAGVSAASKLSDVISHNVIARTSIDVMEIIRPNVGNAAVANEMYTIDKPEGETGPVQADKISGSGSPLDNFTEQELKDMPVVKLRRLLRSIEQNKMISKHIKYARRTELLKILMQIKLGM